jgi:AcrR family transcriptional regulator
MDRPSFKERERQRRETEIIQAAARLIRQRGFSNLNMDDIAEQVGVSKPTLYQHFKSKEEMVEATMIRSIDDMNQFMASQTEGRPIERLESILRYMMGSMLEPDSLINVLSDDDIFMMLHQHPGVIQRRQVTAEFLNRLIEEGKAAGEIDPDLPTQIVAGALFSLMPMVRWQDPNIEVDYPPIQPEEVIRATVRLYLRGIQE